MKGGYKFEDRRLETYDEDIPDLSAATDWDIATRYATFSVPLVRGSAAKATARRLRRAAAREILRRARHVLGSVAHPTQHGSLPGPELPQSATCIQLNLEDTLVHAPVEVTSALHGPSQALTLWPQNIWMDYEIHRQHQLTLCLDASMSMMGENQALVAMAVAVVLLELPEDPVGVLAFDDRASILKRPEERVSTLEVVERMLDVPGRPYTHIEAGLQKALELGTRSSRRSRQEASTVLLTDGKYTAGNDPVYLAARFPHLIVLNIGAAQSGMSLCRDLATRGGGMVYNVPRLAELPNAMYRVVQDILRGYVRERAY